MSPLDVIPIPGHPGKYARRVAVEAWQAAGSPPMNSAGRLYADQKYFYDGWRAGKPGFNPADNPDDENQRLAHVRFVAFDIDPTPARVRALSAAGLVRPYSYEPWHWELPNVRNYAIVRTIPTSGGATTRRKSMATIYKKNNSKEHALAGDSPGTKANWLPTTDADLVKAWAAVHGPVVLLSPASFDGYRVQYTTRA